MKPLLIDGKAIAALKPRMKKYRKITLIDAVQVPTPFQIIQKDDDAARASGQSVISGEVIAPAGSWLVLSPNGTYYPVPAEQFAVMYVEEENT